MQRQRSRRGCALMAALAMATLGLPENVDAAGDVHDQFYRHVELKNKTFEPHLPGETVDLFTGTLRIVQEDLFLPGKAGLDLRIVRAYSSRIWGRTDLLDPEPLLAEKDPSPLGYGWSIHMGRLQRPYATGQPSGCGGGDYPVYEAPDGTARTFYPVGGGISQFVSRDSWKLDTQCTTQQGMGACITTTTADRLEFAQNKQFDVSANPVWPLTAHLDVFGNAIAVDYYTGGRVHNITDTWSRTVTFAYSTCGPRQCLDSITAAGPGGSRVVNYTYTSFPVPPASGNRSFLTGVEPAAGFGYRYSYDAFAPVAANRYALMAITYPHNGGATTYTYNSPPFFVGRDTVPMAAVATRTTQGTLLPTATWQYEYDAPRTSDFQTTTVTRPDNKKDVHQFVGFGYPARMNATGHVWKVGLEVKASYADGAQVEDSTWDKGTVVANANFAAPAYGGGCQGYLWDTVVQSPILTKKVITRGGSWYEMEASGHDPFGQPGTVKETGEANLSSGRPVRITTYKYDYDTPSHQVVGRIANERRCQGTGTSDCMLTSRTFMAPHRRMDSETVKGVITRYRYQPDGDLEEITNALNQTLTLSQYSYGIPTRLDFNGAYTIRREAYWDGSLRSESNGRGDVTEYTYDAAGRLETVSPPGNDASTYDYDLYGRFYTVTRGSGTGAFVETTDLDGLGRVIESRNSLGRRQTHEYDKMGRVVFTSYAFRTGQPEVGDRFEYDGLGRPTTTSRRFIATGHRPLAGACAEPSACKIVTSYLANHCRSTSVDRAPNDTATTRACFESFADPTEERLRVLTDAANKLWRYAYDVDGNLKTFTAPKAAGNRSLTYTPNRFFVSSETSGPRGRVDVMQHDALGHVLEQVDAFGDRTAFEFADPLARPTATTYGAASDDDVARTWDDDVLGSVSSVRGGHYTYGYDEVGRTTSQTWDFGGQSYETEYDYDATGCLTTLTYPTGTIASMTCDAQGRPVRVDRVIPGSTPQNIARNVVYHPMGRIESMTLGNNLTVATGITNGRVTSIRTPGVLDLSFAYDGADNVTRLLDAAQPANNLSSVTYDKLDRILDVTTTAGLARYRYDELGNRTEKTVPGEGTTTYHYDATTNRLSWTSGPSALPVGTLTWTPAERLRTTSDGAVYTYDALGRRVAKQLAAAMIDLVYHYDVSGRLLAETKPDGTPVREYFYAADQLVAVHGCAAVNSSGCNDTQWYHTDHLGSVRARTDASGTVVANVAYAPWGETPAGAPGPALFNGRPFDPGLGLYDLGARAYAPAIGRFVSADTVWSRANPQGANPYAYVLDNPLKHTDPDGHLPLIVYTAGIGAVVGAAVAAYQYRHLDGWSYAREIAAGGASGALIGASLGMPTGPPGLTLTYAAEQGAGAIMLGGGIGLKANQVQRTGRTEDRWNELHADPTVSGVTEVSKDVPGIGAATRSSPPDGGTSAKGVQGGQPVPSTPLSTTPDAGSAPKPSPTGKTMDSGITKDAPLPPQWLPGAIGPKPELHP